jgi:hypothetical protein
VTEPINPARRKNPKALTADPHAVEYLSQPARKERHYLVPASSHGYTLDQRQAELWAQKRAGFAKETVVVLFQDVDASAWEVASVHTDAEIERY